MEHFEPAGDFLGNGTIPIQKFKSRQSPMSVYFADIESPVINGYFSFGIDIPEGNGVETLLWNLDSSGGLLPRPLRGEMLRPVWQLHGAENPLSDRDQSCFACSALGETAFLGTFACSLYLIQNIEAVFEVNGLTQTKEGKDHSSDNLAENVVSPEGNGESVPPQSEDEPKSPPVINNNEDYHLSEAGEGAMAWECTLQELIPSRMFWNRLISETNTLMTSKMRHCYDLFFRPENLTVVITGKINDRTPIFETLRDYEMDYKHAHPEALPFIRPWTTSLGDQVPSTLNANNICEVNFFPRNPLRAPRATICFGWKGCPASDVETSLALKVLSAYLAVGPLWNKFVSKIGLAERISWCQLEYCDVCSLITMHGIPNNEVAQQLCTETLEILQQLVEDESKGMKLKEIADMILRLESHTQRELESDPFVILASSIMKAELYGGGDPAQVQQRVNPSMVLNELSKKSIIYWKNIMKIYFLGNKARITKVLPKTYKASHELPSANTKPELEAPQAQSFASSSKRASSRPRRSNNVGGEASSAAAELTEDVSRKKVNPVAGEASSVADDLSEGVSCMKVKDDNNELETKHPGHFEQILSKKPFPFGDFAEEAKGFERRLGESVEFLKQLSGDELSKFPITTYHSDDEEQHPLFPVNTMPFYTILEDVQTSFVYATLVIDTSHLTPEMRKFISPVVSALGALLCPRPPGLDTDFEIPNPNEFNPPQNICDSQVSVGLNGEMMQGIFITLIVKPEHYKWLVGMFHQLLNETEFSTNFLKFVAEEGVKGMAANYRLQTVDSPNYNCFDSTEINLYSLVKMIYEDESNARLFVGRRRLDLLNEFLHNLEKEPAKTTQLTNLAWKQLAGTKKKILQIGCDVTTLSKCAHDLKGPWQTYFPDNAGEGSKLADCRPLRDHEVLKLTMGNPGLAVSVDHCRPSCLTTAISIPTDEDTYPKICVASQLFSVAQKWAWTCIDEEDVPQPILKMPCAFSNILTLNVESEDVVGALKAVKTIINGNNQWLNSILIATKLMIVNDPACTDAGPQGAIATSLMSHLHGIPASFRQNILMKSISVTPEDIKEVVKTHLDKLFDPAQCWYAFMGHEHDQDAIMKSLGKIGFKFNSVDLKELCTNL